MLVKKENYTLGRNRMRDWCPTRIWIKIGIGTAAISPRRIRMNHETPSHGRSDFARALCLAAGAGFVLLLGACSSLADIPAGTPVSEVQARHGAPTVECPLPDGKRRLVWSTQPMGQYAWSTVASADGTVGRVEQVLTDEAFRQVEIGVWTGEQLQCHFGPPAETSLVGMPSVRSHVWSYRYRQSGAWNSLMHFYLSEDGRVLRMHPGPDPMYDPSEWPFFVQ